MLKEKYELKFEELKKEGKFKYFIVGSPTSLNHVEVVEADTLKELWQELWEKNEIDKERYDEENFYMDEEEWYLQKPKNYKEAIEEYLNKGNNFYYYKANF